MFVFKTAGSQQKPLFSGIKAPLVYLAVLWLGGVLNKKQGQIPPLAAGLGDVAFAATCDGRRGGYPS